MSKRRKGKVSKKGARRKSKVSEKKEEKDE